MSSIGSNILSNLLAVAWIAALTLLITPVQIKLLGIEAYGVIGLITVFQVALSTLDHGLATAVVLAISKDRDQNSASTGLLAASVGTFYWCASVLVGIAIWFSADWMASDWLNSTTLNPQLVADSIRIIAIFLALRWPVAFYGAVLAGLQKMAALNVIKTIAFSLRVGGAILVLLWHPALDAMLAWFALSAAIEVLAYAIVAHRMLPALPYRPTFNFAAARSVWHFSATMSLFGLLALLLYQADRIFISKLLDLQALGYYALAYSVAVGSSLLHTAINSAMLPAFAQASLERTWAVARYNKACELVAFTMAPLCALLIFFGHDLLRLWVGSEAADGAYSSLALLASGFFLNALVSNAHTVAVSFRRPDIPLKINLAAAPVFLPLLGILIWKVGIAGAAISWTILNLYYVFSLLPIVHRKLLGEATLPWLNKSVLPFIVCALIAVGGAKILLISLGPSWIFLCLPLAAVVYAILAYRRLSTESGTMLRHAMKRYLAIKQ